MQYCTNRSPARAAVNIEDLVKMYLKTIFCSSRLYFDEDEPDMDENSRLAVATVWGIPWVRRGSQGQQNNNIAKQAIESKDRIALDISLLKKQYDKLRERQKQAQIILTTACSSAARQTTTGAQLPVNQLLSGRPAIVTNKGRRCRPPAGAIPPARKPSLPAVLHDNQLEKQLRGHDTLLWRDTRDMKNRRDSLSWKEIKAERAALISSGSIDGFKSQKIRSGRLGKSDSSSYSEESDDNDNNIAENASSTDTSLDDEELQATANGKKELVNIEKNHKSSGKNLCKTKKTSLKQRNQSVTQNNRDEKSRPKSWAPSSTEIPFILMSADSPNQSSDENPKTERIKMELKTSFPDENLTVMTSDKLKNTTEADVPFLDREISLVECNENNDDIEAFDISSEGVTNEYFERVNSTERPTKLDLLYSLNEDEPIRDVFKIEHEEFLKKKEDPRFYSNGSGLNKSNSNRCMDLLVDYSEKSSVACIEEAKTEISGLKTESILRKSKTSAEKRKDPRRLTLTRSSTMDIEKRFEAFEKRFSMELCTNYSRLSDELESNPEGVKQPHLERTLNYKKSNNTYDSVYNNACNEISSTSNIILPEKKIPTTADLEERFENIQQQLVRDRHRMNMNSPCDSESSAKQTNSKAIEDNNSQNIPQKNRDTAQSNKQDVSDADNRTEGQVINKRPDIKEKSTAASEYENDEKANTIQESQSHTPEVSTPTERQLVQKNKEPPDEEAEEEIPEKDNANLTNISEAENTNQIQKDSAESKNKSERNSEKTSETIDENQTESMQSNDRNSPPSTEELEKRFSALEEKLNSAKNDSKASPSHQPTELTSSEAVKNEESTANDKNEKDCSQTKLVESKPNSKHTTEKATQRRLSEPPSTEDLERRYEVLKRRMSSRTFETKAFHKEPQLQHTSRNTNLLSSTPKEISNTNTSKKSPPSIENLEERFEKLQTKNEAKTEINTKSLPSTENLEERFEKLQHKIDSNDAAQKPQKPTTSKSQEESVESQIIASQKSNKIPKTHTSPASKADDLQEETTKQVADGNNLTATNPKIAHNASQVSEDNSSDETISKAQQNEEEVSKTRTADVLSKNANKIKIKLIEELQAKIREHSIDASVDNSLQRKMAVIEELKTKIGPLPEKFLKPTEISSRRRPPSQSVLLQSLSFNDETLESHATSANRKSGKHEHASVTNRKMVRRFSDLPSRADLENRLQFLEEQLSKTVGMQRCASDSEVASRAHSKKKSIASHTVSSDSLEYRVHELEKRLKDTRTISMDVECSGSKKTSDPDIEISQVDLAADSVALTGKELVRYSSHGEVGDIERQNPINISINIQMTLNKDDIGNKKTTEDSKTDDLDKRLQLLEQRFKASVVSDDSGIAGDNFTKSSMAEGDTKPTHKSKAEENSLDKNSPSRPIQSTEDIDHLSPNQVEISSSAPENTQSHNFSEPDTSKSSGNPQESLKQDADKAGDSTIATPVIIENKKLENTKCEHSKMQTQKEEIATENREEKGIKDDIPEIKTKQADEHSKTEEKHVSDVSKPPESNSKDDKNIINSLQQKPLIQPDEVRESKEAVHLKESAKSESHRTESETFGPEEREKIKYDESKETKASSESEKYVGKGAQFVPVEVNKKTLVLLLDNEPKAVKVRRLTRANTEELENLFQALEKQLNDREQQKFSKPDSGEKDENKIETSNAMSDLASEIEEFSKSADPSKGVQNDKLPQPKQTKQEEPFDWGADPIKYHLKKRTVYLPSTKELEARFRSLERQIKLLEDVEKINVEHRLTEIERKIKLQYSLSHEKDLNKFLELCEGKDPDEISGLENQQDHTQNTRGYSPNRIKGESTYIEQHYRTPDLDRSKTKQCQKKLPIHPLEMLLDSSLDERDIPTTGELEHRIRVLEEHRCSSSPPSRQSRSKSPPAKHAKSKSTIPILEKMAASPTERELPTAEELEARLEALEREQSFNFKMQKDFQQFNKKLKDAVSPSLSFDEFKPDTKTSDPVPTKAQTSSSFKQTKYISTISSPKTIRFHDVDTSQKEVEPKVCN